MRRGAVELGGTTAVILAGGLGMRLRAAVADRPKVLADVGGRPFLGYLFDQLTAAGVRRAVLCTGYLGEQIERGFGTAVGPLELVYAREASPLGTGGALRNALPLLPSSPVLVLNGDSYCRVDLSALWRAHRDWRAAGTLALVEVDDVGRYGLVEVDARGALTAFREKSAASGRGWINAGVYVLERELVTAVPPDRVISFEREVLPMRIGKGLYGFRAAGPFLDIGTADSYAAAAGFFADVAPDLSPRRPSDRP